MHSRYLGIHRLSVDTWYHCPRLSTISQAVHCRGHWCHKASSFENILVLIHPHSTILTYIFIYFVQFIICYLYLWFLYHCNMITGYLRMETTDFRYNLFLLFFNWYLYNLHGCNFWTHDWQKSKPCCRTLLFFHKLPLVHLAIGHFSFCFHPTSA